MRLTEQKIFKLELEDGRKDRLVFDDVQRGLAVRVTAQGKRFYLAQYTVGGQKYRVPLGEGFALPLASARDAAAAVMGDVAKGLNPALERKQAAQAARAARLREHYTLATLFDDWGKRHLIHRRPRYAKEAVRALKRAFARYLDRPADDLDRGTIVRVLDELGKQRTRKNITHAETLPSGSSMARNTAAYGRAAFSWARKRGAVSVNPFEDLPISRATVKRDRVLDDSELRKVWQTVRDADTTYKRIVILLILTGQRLDEVARMNWHELSPDLTVWTKPSARTKNSAPHIVNLTPAAQAIIARLLPKQKDQARIEFERRRAAAHLVFSHSGQKPFSGWSKAKIQLDAACGVVDWTLHDVRRTMATGLQRLGVRLEVTEAILNHVSGSRSGIVGVYQRHDWASEKSAALEAWTNHVMATCEPRSTPSNVVRGPFNRGRERPPATGRRPRGLFGNQDPPPAVPRVADS